MGGWDHEMKRIIAAKEARRRELAALPWPEKIKIVVAMQRRAAPILAARGIKIRIWDIQE